MHIKFSSLSKKTNEIQNIKEDEKISSFDHHSAFGSEENDEYLKSHVHEDDSSNRSHGAASSLKNESENIRPVRDTPQNIPNHLLRPDSMLSAKQENAREYMKKFTASPNDRRQSQKVGISIHQLDDHKEDNDQDNTRGLDKHVKFHNLNYSKISEKSNRNYDYLGAPGFQIKQKITEEKSWRGSSFSSSSFSSDSSEYDDNILPLPPMKERRRSKTFNLDNLNEEEKQKRSALSTFVNMNRSHNILAAILNMTKKSSTIPSFKNPKNKHDPETYKKYVEQLRSVFNQNKNDEMSIDPKSAKRIRKIIQMENSYYFHFVGFMNLWLDYYSRIYFPILYIFFLIYIFSELASANWVSISIGTIEI